MMDIGCFKKRPCFSFNIVMPNLLPDCKLQAVSTIFSNSKHSMRKNQDISDIDSIFMSFPVKEMRLEPDLL